jgi:hypothetical protein
LPIVPRKKKKCDFFWGEKKKKNPLLVSTRKEKIGSDKQSAFFLSLSVGGCGDGRNEGGYISSLVRFFLLVVVVGGFVLLYAAEAKMGLLHD